jgi:coatomer protein complex subunit alpha (xenin)
MNKPAAPPRPIVSTFQANWPSKSSGVSSFEKALMADGDDTAAADVNGHDQEDLVGEEEIADADGHIQDGEDEDAAGWDMGDDAVADVEDDFVNVESADTGAGSSEADLWVRNSPLAADHAAAGSFDSAMNLLNRQIGAVNFKPLEERFLEIYSASRTLLPANAGMAPLVNHVRRTLTETDSRRVLPIIPRDVESVITGEIVAGKNAMKANKLEDGAASFKKALHLLMVNAAASSSQAEEAAAAIQSAGSYVLAMSVELERRQLIGGATDLSSFDDETKKRALELSAYFTVPTMDAQHQTLAWFSAMNFANRNKQLGSVLGFANALIERGTNAKFKETVSILNFPHSCYVLPANQYITGTQAQGSCRAPAYGRNRRRIRHVCRIRHLRCQPHPHLPRRRAGSLLPLRWNAVFGQVPWYGLQGLRCLHCWRRRIRLQGHCVRGSQEI